MVQRADFNLQHLEWDNITSSNKSFMKVSVFHSTLHLEILLFFKLQYLKKIFNVKNQNNDEQQWPKFENRVLGPLLGARSSLLLG